MSPNPLILCRMAPTSIQLPVSKLCDLRKVGVTGTIIDWSVGLDGEALILTTKGPFNPRITLPDGTSTHQGFSAKNNKYTCWSVRGSQCTSISLPPTRENFSFLRRLNERELLLVRGRVRKGEPPDGAVIDRKGKENRRVSIGDCVQHLFIAPDESLWVGFSDEGFCNPRSRGGGIIRLSRRGRRLLSHPVMDCYAMTMNSDGSIHACTYTDFPMIHLSLKGKLTDLGASPISGINTLLRRNDTLLIDGGYGDSNKLFLAKIGNRRVAQVKLKGNLRPRDLRNRFAIGSTLYILDNSTIHAINVPDVG